jgi:hypothetical protein
MMSERGYLSMIEGLPLVVFRLMSPASHDLTYASQSFIFSVQAPVEHMSSQTRMICRVSWLPRRAEAP